MYDAISAKIASLLATLGLIVASLVGVHVVTAGPADAGVLCNNTGQCPTLTHWSGDTGYNPGFKIVCHWTLGGPDTSTQKWVYPGQSSRDWCGKDFDGLYVNPGTQIKCLYTVYGGQFNYWQVVQRGGSGGSWVQYHDDANFGHYCVYELS